MRRSASGLSGICLTRPMGKESRSVPCVPCWTKWNTAVRETRNCYRLEPRIPTATRSLNISMRKSRRFSKRDSRLSPLIVPIDRNAANVIMFGSFREISTAKQLQLSEAGQHLTGRYALNVVIRIAYGLNVVSKGDLLPLMEPEHLVAQLAHLGDRVRDKDAGGAAADEVDTCAGRIDYVSCGQIAIALSNVFNYIVKLNV